MTRRGSPEERRWRRWRNMETGSDGSIHGEQPVDPRGRDPREKPSGHRHTEPQPPDDHGPSHDADGSDANPHTTTTTNPHSVTHSQVGAPTGNPHGVTAEEAEAVRNSVGSPGKRRENRADQPAPSNVAIGTESRIKDEGDILEIATDTDDDGVADTWEEPTATHGHDDDYVNVDGDTMSNALTILHSVPELRLDRDGTGYETILSHDGTTFDIGIDTNGDGAPDAVFSVGRNGSNPIITADSDQVDVDTDVVLPNTGTGGAGDWCFHVGGSSPADALIDLWGEDGAAEFAGQVYVGGDLQVDHPDGITNMQGEISSNDGIKSFAYVEASGQVRSLVNAFDGFEHDRPSDGSLRMGIFDNTVYIRSYASDDTTLLQEVRIEDANFFIKDSNLEVDGWGHAFRFLCNGGYFSSSQPQFRHNVDSDNDSGEFGVYREFTNSAGDISIDGVLEYVHADTHLRPGDDAATDLGTSGNRWQDIWASNDVIQTSDIAAKDNIEPIDPGEATARVRRVAGTAITFTRRDGTRGRRHAGFDAEALGQAVSGAHAAYVDPSIRAAEATPGERRDGPGDGPKGVRDGELTADLYAAIAHLADRVEALEAA